MSTASPGAKVPKRVTLAVCGMMFTPKVSPWTSFTVNDTPSMATLPLAAMKRATSIGTDAVDEGGALGGLNASDLPSVLSATANLQNPADAALLQNPDVRQRFAHALAAGLARYFSNPAPPA